MKKALKSLQQQNFYWLVGMLLIPSLSLVALTSLPVQVKVQKNETVVFIPLFKDVSAGAVTLAPVTVQAPLHGTLTLVPAKTYFWKQQRPATPAWKSIPVTWYQYVPADPGFTGIDSFTYQMTDGAGNTSNTSTAVLRIHPQEPGGMTVLIAATPTMATALGTKINRLKSDLEADGYAARVISFSGTVQALWDTLNREYNRPGAFMAGALLIGNMVTSPIPHCEKPYWNMSFWSQNYFTDSIWSAFGGNNNPPLKYDTTFGNTGYISPTWNRSLLHIWIGRFYGAGQKGGGVSSYGSEAGLIERQLDANHDYRTNVSRYPHKAYVYDLYGSKTFNANLVTAVVPEVMGIQRDGRIDFPGSALTVYQPGQAGQYWYISSEQNTIYLNTMSNSIWYWPRHDVDTIMFRPFQQRFAFFEGCHSGCTGGIVNAHVWTRGGGCVLSVGPWDYRFGNYRYCLADTTSYAPGKLFRSLLSAGERVGAAWIRSDIGNTSLYFFGDPSLKPNMDTPNAAPIVDSLVRSRPGAGKFRYTAAARDPDGTVQTYEWWFNKTYNYGRNEPDSTTSVPVIEVDSVRCTTAVRVEAVDQWKARFYAILPKGSDLVRYTVSAVEEQPAASLSAAPLSIFPNPFRPGTALHFMARSHERVLAAVYSPSGRLVRVIHDGTLKAGPNRLVWDGRDGQGFFQASGMYLFQVRIGEKVLQSRAMLMK